jgi:hypothetical protein
VHTAKYGECADHRRDKRLALGNLPAPQSAGGVRVAVL